MACSDGEIRELEQDTDAQNSARVVADEKAIAVH
ncbi:hypothetical protein SAMN05443661_11142 [Natronobacterium gregoryi]|uniref:Uncharacterized protein n=2 Tax=Natronobacterium gregoryi TaxID=44930 RepID=L0AIR2_NATGS|nr:hypothetical protein Natgr_2513 [Natronobacterium gregoryi SP2]SFJ00787.1 hypothetical protein SAMN05443661_11142 [Natronobacterium gregoryi]